MLYNQIINLFKEACICRLNDNKNGEECQKCGGDYHDKSHRCYTYNSGQFSTLKEFYRTFPTFDFQFEFYKIYQWFPSEYLVWESNNTYCIGIDQL